MEAAFFDLDKTVIAKASMVAFGRPLYRQGLISRRLLVRALYGQLVYMHLGANEAKLERMRQSVLALTKGWEQARVSSIVREALTEVVEPIIRQQFLVNVSFHNRAEHHVHEPGGHQQILIFVPPVSRCQVGHRHLIFSEGKDKRLAAPLSLPSSSIGFLQIQCNMSKNVRRG